MSMDALRRYKADALLEEMRRKRRKPAYEAECEPCTAAAETDVPFHGLAALYDTWTSDGGEVRRMIEQGALFWDLEEEGIPIVVEHDGGAQQVIGRVDEASNTDTGMAVSGRLFDDGTDEFKRILNLISENALGWSIMMSEEQGTVRFIPPPEPTEGEDGSFETTLSVMQELRITSARVRHLAIVDVPAFPGARPELGLLPVAASVRIFPASHFERWESSEQVPLRVEKDGRVWGMAAGEGCYRNGSSRCERYTADPDPEMRNFHTSTVTLDSGEVIRSGNLTCSSLHADTSLTQSEQRQYHENTSTVWARVVAWNDRQGRLCITGSVVPGLDQKTLAQVSGQPISVELWPVPGIRGLTLVGAHTVPLPAWPVGA